MPDKARDDLMSDFITRLHRQRRSTSNMRLTKAATASWLDWHGKKYTRRFKFPRAQTNSLTSGYGIPDQACLGRIFDAGDTQERLGSSLIAHSSLRPGILGNTDGSHGLQFKHLPEAHLTPEGITFDRIPTMIKVPAYLSKARNDFFTFLGPEGCAYLAADVKRRIQAGEKLTLESPVMAPDERTRTRFMASKTVRWWPRLYRTRFGQREPLD